MKLQDQVIKVMCLCCWEEVISARNTISHTSGRLSESCYVVQNEDSDEIGNRFQCVLPDVLEILCDFFCAL